MPGYTVKVTYIYPVNAVNPRDALSTVPMVVKARLPMVISEGSIEVLDTGTGELALKAVLNPEKGQVKAKI